MKPADSNARPSVTPKANRLCLATARTTERTLPSKISTSFATRPHSLLLHRDRQEDGLAYLCRLWKADKAIPCIANRSTRFPTPLLMGVRAAGRSQPVTD